MEYERREFDGKSRITRKLEYERRGLDGARASRVIAIGLCAMVAVVVLAQLAIIIFE